jgi:hypothetical protein
MNPDRRAAEESLASGLESKRTNHIEFDGIFVELIS